MKTVSSTSKSSRIDFTSLSNPLPIKIVLDSSILVYLALSGPQGGLNPKVFQDAKAFLSRLQKATVSGSCVALAPQLVITECYHVLTRWAIEGQITNIRWDIAYKSNPQLIRQLGVRQKCLAFLNDVEAAGIIIIDEEDLLPLTPDAVPLYQQSLTYMESLNLLSSDAYILAVADRLGVEALASLDKDFLRITQADFDIYTSPVVR